MTFKRVSLAWTRKQYKEAIESRLTGMLPEYFKARIYAANGGSKWVQHWDTKVRRLRGELRTDLLKFLKEPGIDRWKVFMGVFDEYKNGASWFHEVAYRELKRRYSLTVEPVDLADATEAIFDKIWQDAYEIIGPD